MSSKIHNTTDWSDIVFKSKKELNSLKAIFIFAPRDMSLNRFKQIMKQYLPKGNIVLGIANEPYVLGFDKQPQFKMLRSSKIISTINQINESKLPHRVQVLTYSQRDIIHIIEKLRFSQILLVNGSWKFSFHTRPEFYAITTNNTPYQYISPFSDEDEAQKYAKETTEQIKKTIQLPEKRSKKEYSEKQLFALVQDAAKQSFDHTFQTGAVLVERSDKKYKLISAAYNQIVPYESFALHHGASRERFFSPPNDLNHYDTVHAEVQAAIEKDLQGRTLFINLLPCPVCSRILVKSGLREIVYQNDHSDGYAIQLLSQANIKVRRFVAI